MHPSTRRPSVFAAILPALLQVERELDAARHELVKLRHQLAAGGGAGSSDASSVVLGMGIDPMLVRRGQAGNGSSANSNSGNNDIIPMDALGEPYQRLARHNKVGKAVKAAANLLDGTASTAAWFLRQYPLGRLAVFGYLLLLHLYLYMLLARMQRFATHMENAVVVPGQ